MIARLKRRALEAQEKAAMQARRRSLPLQTASQQTPFLPKTILRKSPGRAVRLAFLSAVFAMTGAALALPATAEASAEDAAANQLAQQIKDKKKEKLACNDETCRRRVDNDIYQLQNRYTRGSGAGALTEGENEFGARGGRDLDGVGKQVITDSGHYDREAKRLGNQIKGLDSKIESLNQDLANCNRNPTSDARGDCGHIQEQINNKRQQRDHAKREKTRAEKNRDSLAEYDDALAQTEAAQRDASASAKKKVEKQKKFMYLAAGISGAAGAYYFKKCYASTPPNYGFCVMGGLAVANAGINVKKAGDLGTTAGQLGSVGQGICSSMPHLCAPGSGACNSHPAACRAPDGFCNENPAQCTTDPDNPDDPPQPPPDLCVQNPGACVAAPAMCETNPEACEPKPPDPTLCAQKPFPPQCIQAEADCEGESCPTTITTDCPNGRGICDITVPAPPEDGSGGFAGDRPFTITPLNGDPPYKVPIGEAPDYTDPAIKAEIAKANRHLKNTQAAAFDAIDALNEGGMGGEGFGGASSQGDSALSDRSPSAEESYGFGKAGAGGADSFAGNSGGGLGLGGQAGGLRRKQSPYKNLMSQYKGRQKANLLGEKSITLGEDRIGVAEDNIFFMARSAYDEGRKGQEFCGDPVPCPLPAHSLNRKAASAAPPATGGVAAPGAAARGGAARGQAAARGGAAGVAGANKADPFFVPPPPGPSAPPPGLPGAAAIERLRSGQAAD